MYCFRPNVLFKKLAVLLSTVDVLLGFLARVASLIMANISLKADSPVFQELYCYHIVGGAVRSFDEEHIAQYE